MTKHQNPLFPHSVISAKAGILCVGLLLLSACDLKHPTYISPQKLQIVSETIEKSYSANHFTRADAQAIAAEYQRHGGEGGVGLHITYDARHRGNTAMMAGDRAGHISTLLRREGVPVTDTGILPTKDSGVESQLLLSYGGISAAAPNCQAMPGLEERNVDIDYEYALGCGLETQFAKQIANPRDLLGKKTAASSDGRRAANVVDRYRTGMPNEKLQGEAASGGD